MATYLRGAVVGKLGLPLVFDRAVVNLMLRSQVSGIWIALVDAVRHF